MKTLLAMILMTVGLNAAAADFNRENVEIAFDRQKGRIYALYAKALREKPGLKGKIVYEIDIAKSGAVTGCRVQSSALGSPALEGQICDVIRQMKLPPQSQGATITKPIDFFPAG
jgi:periplasmic protein TonB